tara:strand:- start:3592 stop:4914 length:1323 start_codon:yes stop_codon:yes gene_type:complete
MSGHTRSGGTKVNTGTGTSQGCKSGNFCTAGKQGPGGTYSSTFDLEDNMTIDQINRGFTMDYGMDVDSHVSNSRLASCVNGNTMQAADCRDIVNLTVSLFDGTALKHKFEHELELDFNGVRNFSFSQTIPQNTYSSLTGDFEMFGIDAGFGSKFFGPAFSAPFLTTTFDLVTLIETEVIDIINNTDIIDNNTPDDVTVETIEVEVETADGQQLASLELEVNTEMTMEMELEMPSIDMPTPTQEVQVEVAEVSAEIETEIQNDSLNDMAGDQPAEPTENTSDTGTESEPEQASSTDQDGESENTNETSANPEESQADPEPQVAESTDSQESEESSNQQAKPRTKVKAKKSAKQKAARKIVKKMGDKGKYDSTNQLKTLVVMQVLGNTKTFFDAQKTIPQPTGFFTDKKMPDSQLPENNAAAWLLIKGNNQLHDKLIGSQYR